MATITKSKGKWQVQIRKKNTNFILIGNDVGVIFKTKVSVLYGYTRSIYVYQLAEIAYM